MSSLASLEHPKVLKYLREGELNNLQQEQGIARLRAKALRRVANGDEVPLEVLSALSSFCFACEYVIEETAEETDLIGTLKPDTSSFHRFMFGCYRPISSETLPFEDIPALHPSLDNTSKSVQEQYEQNPYPRWRTFTTGEPTDEALDMLSAGCGTGHEVITDAIATPKSSFTAIDLSRASLAYAMARAREHGVNNIRFLHGDLRDLHLLGMKFDRIKSIGVLHHMRDPLEGLISLKSVLKPDGQIKIAVYTAKGRSAVLRAIQMRKDMGIPATPTGIRAFRKILIELPNDHPAKPTILSPDFYSMSGTRDLLFHVQEHNFTVPEIVSLIGQSGLRIVRFGAASDQKARFHAMGYPDDGDLNAWAAAEEANPGLFSRGMYSILLSH